MATRKRQPKTTQKVTGFKWDERRNLAAQKVAEGEQNVDEIAKACGVTRKALWEWRQHPDFAARVEQIIEEQAAKLLREGIRRKENRLRNLQARVDKMLTLIEERAKEMDGEIAGGGTGLLVRDYKGKDADIPIYKFDAAVVKELREHERQAAQELGEWTEKREITGKDGKPLTVERVREMSQQEAYEYAKEQGWV